uniref:Reverse transcriptase domain-containing protein n=1 Tax=Romanomermis culicivorax TaxID=13658 RepID=A0A915JZG9_ROMCU
MQHEYNRNDQPRKPSNTGGMNLCLTDLEKFYTLILRKVTFELRHHTAKPALKANFAHEGYNRFNKNFTLLAYADDLVLFSKASHMMQNMVIYLNALLKSVNLQLKPSKCASSSLDKGTVVGQQFDVDGKIIQALMRYDVYSYLGTAQGISAVENKPSMEIV